MKWGVSGLGILMVLTLISAARAEPSGLLNDTGQTQCLNVTGTALEECTPENSGDDMRGQTDMGPHSKHNQ